MANFERISKSALAFAKEQKGAPSDGAMLAFFLDPALGLQLMVPGGEPIDQLHITLFSFGEREDFVEGFLRANCSPRAFRAALGNFAQQCSSLEGEIAGIGCFTARPETNPFLALVDIPGLPLFYQKLQTLLDELHISYQKNHGYTPHITLKYLQSGEKLPFRSLPPLPFLFSGMSLAVDQKRFFFPFQEKKKIFSLYEKKEKEILSLSFEENKKAFQQLLQEQEQWKKQNWIENPILGTATSSQKHYRGRHDQRMHGNRYHVNESGNRVLKPKPENYKTAEEAGLFLQKKYGIPVSLGNMADSIAVRTVTQLDKLFQEYPGPKEKLVAIGAAQTLPEAFQKVMQGEKIPFAAIVKSGDSYALAYSDTTFGSEETFRQKIAKVSDNYLVDGSIEGLSTHEYGHLVKFHIESANAFLNGVEGYGPYDIGTVAGTYRLWEQGQVRKGTTMEVSEYGKANADEAFAEGFTSLHFTPEEKQSAYVKSQEVLLKTFYKTNGEQNWGKEEPSWDQEMRRISRDASKKSAQTLKPIVSALELDEQYQGYFDYFLNQKAR